MSLLSRDQILSAPDLATIDVDVPEWGGTVRLKTMTGAERDAFENEIVQQKKSGTRVNLLNVRARLLSRVIVDEHGAPLFSRHDIEALGQKSSRALDRLADAAGKLNAINDEDLEELAEDFGKAPGGSSTSG